MMRIPDFSKLKLIVVGGSAGSFLHMLEIARTLPANFPVPLLFVLHRSRSVAGYSPEKLERYSGFLRSQEVEDKVHFEPGYVYWAPSNFHVLVEENCFSIDASEPVWYSRPSIDVSFESAAQFLGPAVAGILLSGANHDGAAGLQAIQQAGGFTCVEDPEGLEFPAMPLAAIGLFEPDLVAPFDKILQTLMQAA